MQNDGLAIEKNLAGIGPVGAPLRIFINVLLPARRFPP